jgi:hypothetical protein
MFKHGVELRTYLVGFDGVRDASESSPNTLAYQIQDAINRNTQGIDERVPHGFFPDVASQFVEFASFVA